MGIDEGDFGAEFTELGEVDGAVFVDPVVDEGATVGGGADDGEEGEIVDVEAGEGHGVDFVGWGGESGFFKGDVDEAGATVVGEIFGAEIEVEAHVFEDFEFDFEEFDGSSSDGDFGFSDDTGGDETHGFDGVFARAVLDVFADLRFAVDGDGRGADAFDFNTELFEVEADVLDHVVAAGVSDGGFAGPAGGAHEGVFGDGVAALGEDDLAVGFIGRSDGGGVEAAGGFAVDAEAERFEGF